MNNVSDEVGAARTISLKNVTTAVYSTACSIAIGTTREIVSDVAGGIRHSHGVVVALLNMTREWRRVLFYFLWSIVAVVVIIEIPHALGMANSESAEWRHSWREYMQEAETEINKAGSALAFLLAFRLNRSFGRWWEARVLWGKTIGKCIRTAQLVGCHLSEPARKERVFKWLSAYPILLRSQLVGKSNKDLQGERGTLCEELKALEPQEVDDVAEQAGWAAGYACEVIRACVVADLKAWEGRADATAVQISRLEVAHREIEEMLSVLMAACGGLMRIKGTTGQPVATNAFLAVLMDVYFFVAPWTWAASAGWLSPPFLLIICILYLGMHDLGLMLERPFAGNGIALDMERFCKVIQVNVDAVRKRHVAGAEGAPPVRLDLPPSERPRTGTGV